MKYAGVGIERLLGREVACNSGVVTQRHSDGGCGWAEELGQICGGVGKPSALAPVYQGNNL